MLAAFLDLTAQTALVVGGGQVALRRVARLKAADMHVRVVAPEILAEVRALADSVYQRPFEPSDLHGAALVVACTGDAALNRQVAALSRGRGLLVNDAGNAQMGNLVFPAVWEQGNAQQGGVSVAVHTTPSVPLLSQALCAALARRYPAPWPVSQWAQQRQHALNLSGAARQWAMLELRQEIEQVVK